jgi:hypothetical protein
MIHAMSWESAGIPGQSKDFTATLPVPRPYKNHTVKNQVFICSPHACFETGFWIRPRIRGRLVKEFSKKKKKKDEVRYLLGSPPDANIRPSDLLAWLRYSYLSIFIFVN